MIFSDSQMEAGERLRMVLPFLTKNKLAAHPANYCIAYVYFSGSNGDLTEAMDNQINNGGIDESVMTEMFKKYFAEDQNERVEVLRSNFEKIISNVLPNIATAGNDASHYGETLKHNLEDLKTNNSPEALQGIVNKLISNTEGVSKSNQQLQKNLNAAQKESELLRSELKKAKEEATIDALTGLFNRKTLERKIDQFMVECVDKTSGLCVIMLDIDHFKKFNDTFGHLVGDEVIRRVAATLKNCVRGSDVAARYGGEEFTILLPETPLNGAVTVADNVRSSMEKLRLNPCLPVDRVNSRKNNTLT